jgi:hypothetical protein
MDVLPKKCELVRIFDEELLFCLPMGNLGSLIPMKTGVA